LVVLAGGQFVAGSEVGSSAAKRGGRGLSVYRLKK